MEKPGDGESHARRTGIGGLWHSLSGRLFTLVFSGYLCLAILVTAVQLVLEYRYITENIRHDLANLGQSFQESASEAMWIMDHKLLGSMAIGMDQPRYVTGVKIMTVEGRIIAQSGNIDGSETTTGFLESQQHKVPLTVMSNQGPQPLGSIVLYSGSSVVKTRLQYSFMVVLLNTLVKTLGLWAIFYLVINRGLARPISTLTSVIKELEFAAKSHVPISLDYPHDDELGQLVSAMREMQQRLLRARKELDRVNMNLEHKLEERENAVIEAQNKIKLLAIEQSQLAERERLMQDMHDGFGSQLASACMRLERNTLSQEDITELLNECVADLYLVIDTLSENNKNLQDSLTDYKYRCDLRTKNLGTRLVWNILLEEAPIIPQRDILHILRIIQEALHNALKHAGATLILVEASFEEESGLRVVVKDNGKGFNYESKVGIGLTNMRKRCKALGGSVIIENIDKGTTLTFRAPLKVL